MGKSETGWAQWASTLEGPKFAEFQRGLTAYNTTRLTPALPDEAPPRALALEYTVSQAEIVFVEAQRAAIAPLIADVPTKVDSFLAW